METFLVTGGAGFIGSHLCESLLSTGNRVVLLDSFNDYYSPEIKRRNVQDIKTFCYSKSITESSLIIIEGDIRDAALLSSIFSNNKIDCVVHLAAYAGVRFSMQNPSLYFDVNVNGTLCILEAMKQFETKRMVFASSSSIYGNNVKTPFSEEDRVDSPISPYAASKKAGELMCYTYSYLYDFSIACLRFFTVYGPRQRPDLAIHKFTKLIMEGREVPFFGDGSSKRDYTYVGDIVQGCIKATQWTGRPQNHYDIFNLGESRTISLKQMLDTIELTLGKKANLKKLPQQMGDLEVTSADIDKAIRILGYDPLTGFEEGISQFIDWYKEMN